MVDPLGLAGIRVNGIPFPFTLPGGGGGNQSSASGTGNDALDAGLGGKANTGSCPSPNGCQALYDAIDGVVFNLQQRYRALIADKYKLSPTGPMSVAGHQQQFLNRQAQLRKLLNQSNVQGCTGYRSDAWEWATIPAPSPGG